MKVLVCLMIVSVIIAAVHASVSWSPIEIEKVYGRKVKYCAYKGLKMLPKSAFTDYDDCMRCTCIKKNGLDCKMLKTACPIKHSDESKCENVRIGCVNTWVLKSDKSKKCPKSEPLPMMRSSVC